MFFLPWILGRGHLIAMIDTARIFAAHGAKVTILTTPGYAQLYNKTVQRDQSLGRNISFHTFKLPTAEFGLPDGCENHLNVLSLPTRQKLKAAINKLQVPIEQLLCERRPGCLVSDRFFPWSVDSCDRARIPNILFHVVGLFSTCCEDSVRRYRPHEAVESNDTPFTLPGLPHQVEFTRRKIPNWLMTETEWAEFVKQKVAAEKRSYGVIFNSFYELEPGYAEYYLNKCEMGKKIWLVGPVYLFNKDEEDKAERGEKNSTDGKTILNWLNSKKPNSVLYVTFGSMFRMAPEQFFEIAQGLEASGHDFIWVARDMSEYASEGEGGRRNLPEGFEERMATSGRGLVIKKWAPQLQILEHPAIGGFMTHCGWNSTVEGVGSGVPMITWPLASEQFFAESLVVDVLKMGVRVGNEDWMFWEWEPKLTVARDKVEAAVRQLMGGGKEVEEMRMRARELSDKAKKAIEPGGSSQADVVALINEIKLSQNN
ncbi:Abscisate beta-glucosyltransferase [Bertholletia excelsa]